MNDYNLKETENEVHDVLNYPLLILSNLGLCSKKKTKKLVVAILLTAAVAYVLLTALLQFSNLNGNVLDFVNSLEGLTAFLQNLLKLFFTMYKQKKMIQLAETTKLFWSTSKCEKKLQVKLDNILVNTMRLGKLFFISMMATILLMFSTIPLLGRPLLIGSWNLEGHDILHNKWTLCLQVITVPILVFFNIALDGIFFAFCMEIIIQFRILCDCIRKLNTYTVSPTEQKERSTFEITQHYYYSQLKLLIQHHNFLLKFLKEFQNVFTPLIMIPYVTISPLQCAEMYAVLDNNSLPLTLVHAMTFLSLNIQLMFYCIPATLVSAEALEVSKAAYEFDWYSNYFPALRTPIKLLMQKSQQEVIFRAGGLFDINVRSLVTVLKVSWSLCTVMRVLKEK